MDGTFFAGYDFACASILHFSESVPSWFQLLLNQRGGVL